MNALATDALSSRAHIADLMLTFALVAAVVAALADGVASLGGF